MLCIECANWEQKTPVTGLCHYEPPTSSGWPECPRDGYCRIGFLQVNDAVKTARYVFGQVIQEVTAVTAISIITAITIPSGVTLGTAS